MFNLPWARVNLHPKLHLDRFSLPTRPIHTVQNNAARVVLQAPRLSHANSLLQELQWLPVEQCITYKLAVLTYKTRQTSVPEYLSRHITTRSSTRALRSSSAPLLHVPFRRTSFSKCSFSTAAPSVWNSLPVSVQNYDTLTLFKSRLKAHLFSSIYASQLSCSPAPLKPRQHGVLEILYCIVLYCIVWTEREIHKRHTTLHCNICSSSGW